MSSILVPEGPLPAAVYWRRRGIAIAAIAALVWTISAFFPQGENPATTATPEATDSAPAVTACDPAVVTLVAIADKNSYAASEKPQFSMTITNSGAVDCILEVGTDKQRYVVTSGDEVIWDSSVCQEGAEALSLTFAAGETKQPANLAWSRLRSSSCGADAPAAVGGGASYHLSVFLGDVKSTETVQFMLF